MFHDKPPTGPSLMGHPLNGRYELLEQVGEGVLFATFRARDMQGERDVFVKTVLPEYAQNTEILASLRNGVGDVLGFSHVGIVRPFDIGADEAMGVSCYVAEEYVGGLNLADRIHEAAPFAHSVVAGVLICLAEALEYAAERNVRHGDVRPIHIFAGPETPIRLSGWGAAEAQSIAAGENPVLLMPSALYTAPEVWATGVPTTGGDLYALGVIAYELLTGSLPFDGGGDVLAIARRHANEPVPSPRERDEKIPRALDGVTQKLLAKRAADRYATPAGLLADLRLIRDALRLGRSLAWSPLDADDRTAPAIPAPAIPAPAISAPAISAPAFDMSGTAVMPTPAVMPTTKVVGGRSGTGSEPRVLPQPLAEAVLLAPTIDESQVATPAAYYTDPEDEIMPAAISAPKRKGFSFSWLLPFNLFLATVLVATCGYVINLMFLALEPPTDVIVPNLVGKSLTEAKTLGAERKFVVEIVNEQFNDKYPEDTVYQMRPEAGRHIRENKKVTVWVSKGPRMVTVPDVFDVSFDKARQVLEKEGLRVGEKKYEWDVMTAKGYVVQQIPPEGENRQRGTRIDLVISKGPEPVATPDPYISEPPPLPDEETVPVENQKKSSLTLQYDVPADTNTHIIRIDVIDSRGMNTLITESHNGGDKVPLEVTGYGNKITFKVYDNDEKVQEYTGPPWPGGEKAP